MATRTTSQAGIWSSSATWGGSTPPGNGDTASVVKAVTVDVNTTVGRSLQGAGWRAVTVAATGGSGSATALPTGAYRVAYTIDDGAGGETSVGVTESAAVTFTNASSIPLITFPAAPPTGCTYSLYLSNTGGAAGTARRYVTGITTATYGATFQSQWENNTVAFGSAQAEPAFTGTCAITVGTNGSISVNTGVTLTVRGDINQASGATGAFTLSAGSALVFDPTQCGSSAKRAQAKYVFNPGGAGGVFVANGSNGSRCTVSTLRTNGDEGTAFFALPAASASSSQGLKTSTYTDWTDIYNNATFFGIWTRDDITNSTVVYNTSNSTFTRCSYLGNYGQSHTWDSSITFQYNKFASSPGVTVGGRSLCFQMTYFNGITSGTRLFDSNYFDLQQSNTLWNVTYTNNVAVHSFSNVAASTWANDTFFNNNFISFDDNADGSWTINGSIKNCYIYDSFTPNAHPVLASATPTVLSITGCICESLDTSNTGECFQPNKNTSGSTFSVTFNLGLPTSNGKGGWNCVAYNSATSTTKATIEHNTWFSATENGFANVGETVNEVTNTFASVRANLVVQPSGGGNNYILIDRGANNVLNVVGVPDAVTYFGANHNAIYNPTTGTIHANGSNVSATGYAGLSPGIYNIGSAYPSDQTGNNDVNLGTGSSTQTSGPQFVDPTRTAASWGTAFKSTDGTQAGLLAYFAANVTTLSTDIPAMMQWVRAGFVVQNSALLATSYASDPSTVDANGNAWPGGNAGIGAMGFSAVAAGTITLGSLSPSGAATFTGIGSGAVALAALSVAGLSTFTAIASGAVSLAALTVSGFATAAGGGASSGLGIITLAPLLAAGSATGTITATATITLAPLVVSGQGNPFPILAFVDPRLGYILYPNSDPAGVDPRQGYVIN